MATIKERMWSIGRNTLKKEKDSLTLDTTQSIIDKSGNEKSGKKESNQLTRFIKLVTIISN
jgi:hypothetical protein